MGRILANGEIVHDNDPRAKQPSQRSQGSRMGTIQHDDNDQQQQEGGNQQQGMGGQVSVFDTLNQRLVDGGFPRWNAGPYVVEPIVSIGFILAGVFAGFAGLIFAGLLFLICKYSAGEGNIMEWWRGGGRGTGGERTIGSGGIGGRRLGGPSRPR